MYFVSLNYKCSVSYSSSSYCFPLVVPLCKWNKWYAPLKVDKWNKPFTPLCMYIVLCSSNNLYHFVSGRNQLPHWKFISGMNHLPHCTCILHNVLVIIIMMIRIMRKKRLKLYCKCTCILLVYLSMVSVHSIVSLNCKCPCILEVYMYIVSVHV